MAQKKGLVWVPEGGYQLPDIPEELKVDPVLAGLLHLACYMEFSDENAVDFDESLSCLEAMGYYLQRLNAGQCKEIERQLSRVVSYGKRERWGAKVVTFIRRFLKNAGK